MLCDICGKDGAIVRHVSRSYGSGIDLLVVQGVPTVSCPHCGESYLTAETLHEIARVREDARNLAVVRPVAVADLHVTV